MILLQLNSKINDNNNINDNNKINYIILENPYIQ